MENKPLSIFKVKEFFSEEEYLEISDFVKLSKKLAIFHLNHRGNSSLHFLAVANLKAIGEDNQRIEMSSVIDNYQAIDYNGEIHTIYENNDPEFENAMLEAFTENI